MKNLEIEYKVLINKNDFNELENKLADVSYEEYEQVNTYYDTISSTLNEKKLSLRIRHIVNKNIYITTLKESKKVGKMEYEFVIDSNEVTSLPKEIVKILNKNKVTLKDLVVVGKLTTHRKEYDYKNTKLCLDHNRYYDVTDYEIECEAQSMDEAMQVVHNLLVSNNIAFIPSKYSKQARARQNRK